jgi:amidohydrolase
MLRGKIMEDSYRFRLSDALEQVLPHVIAWRRHIHKHPELSFQEAETALFVQKVLKQYDIDFQSGIGGHGVKAVVTGKKSGGHQKAIALRADMDALPIEELSDVSYRSCRQGVMHACGHDVHTANLLGVAALAKSLEDYWSGTMIFLFQPAEERLPGGASLMIKDGVLENPTPAAILGLHVYPQLPAGHVGMRAGEYMASADELYLTIRGKGGHGAMPHLAVDPIWVSAQVLTAVQSLISRRKNPLSPSVLTFGKIASLGGSTNVIPDEVYMEGTFRAMDEAWRAQAHTELLQICLNTAAAYGAEADLRIEKGYPVLVNDNDVTAEIRASAQRVLGEHFVHELDKRMTAEDFSYYSQKIPACFFRLGTAGKNGLFQSPLHTPYFDVDESCFETGMVVMLTAAMDFLSKS